MEVSDLGTEIELIAFEKWRHHFVHEYWKSADAYRRWLVLLSTGILGGLLLHRDRLKTDGVKGGLSLPIGAAGLMLAIATQVTALAIENVMSKRSLDHVEQLVFDPETGAVDVPGFFERTLRYNASEVFPVASTALVVIHTISFFAFLLGLAAIAGPICQTFIGEARNGEGADA